MVCKRREKYSTKDRFSTADITHWHSRAATNAIREIFFLYNTFNMIGKKSPTYKPLGVGGGMNCHGL